MTDLPPGWEWTTMEEIADTTLGKMLDRSKSKGYTRIPYLRNVDVQWDGINTEGLPAMEMSAEEVTTFALAEGDVLVCEGGEIGRAAIWQGSVEPVGFQKALHRIRPVGGIDGKFIRYLLKFMSESGRLDENATGSTIKHLPQVALRRLRIALPPLAEQRRIIEIVDSLLSGTSQGQAALDVACESTESAIQRFFDDLLDREPTRDVQVGDVLAAPLSNGRSVPTRPGGFAVLRLSALKQGEIDLNERKEGDWTFDSARPYLVEPGDFLVSRGNGSLRFVGRGGLVPIVERPVAFPDTMIRVRLREDLVNLQYFKFVWHATQVRAQIERCARTTAGIFKISQGDIRSVLLPLPSLERQVAIASEYEEIASSFSSASGAVRSIRDRVAHLESAILEDAFSGRLIAQNRNDEPASALLDRVRAERAAVPPRARRRPTASKANR